MTRQIFRLFALLIFVLLMQWGGTVHAISHLGDDQDQPHTACELCVAYSAFDHGLTDTTAKAPVADYKHTGPVAPFFWLAQLSPSHGYHSRAPPQAAF